MVDVLLIDSLKSEILGFEQIHYRYPGCDSEVLKGIACSLKRGEITALAGLSASGKSTFGRITKGLIKPTGGVTYLEHPDSERYELSSAQRMKIIGWAGPHPELQLFASTVKEEVEFGPANLGITGIELEARVDWALQKVGLDPNRYLSRDPFRLSGGEKRRLALAGVIAMHSDYYILDEPTAGLDDDGHGIFIDLMKSLRDDGCGILWITHNISQLAGVIDRLWLLKDGELVMDEAENQVNWDDLIRKLTLGISK